MRRAAILLGSLLAATPAAAKAPLPWPSGTYGNVHAVDETGDMLGMEARFFAQGGRRMVEFVWCEGWCNDVHVMLVTRGDRRSKFQFSRRAGGDPNSRAVMRFVAWPANGGLKISAWQGREKLDQGGPQQLRRLVRPFAIPFAKVNGAR